MTRSPVQPATLAGVSDMTEEPTIYKYNTGDSPNNGEEMIEILMQHQDKNFFLKSISRGLWEYRINTNPNICVIETSYCRWVFDETKPKGSFHCESVGKNSPSATDKERIAFYISSLPSDDWTIDINFAQVCEWIIHRTWAIRIAKCFLAGYNQRDNTLDCELNEGRIDEYQRDLTWLVSDKYENLWKLITRKEKKIKTALIKTGEYPFTDSCELFQEIIKALIESNFLKCFQRNYINRPREIKSLTNLSRHQLNGKDLSQIQEEKLNNLTKKYRPQNPWYERLIQVSTNLAESDDIIRAHMQIEKALNDALLAMEQKAQCNPNLSQHAEKNYAWRRGMWYPT